MNETDAKSIIENQQLIRVNWFDEKNLNENQVGIKKISNGWEVYITDERASIIDGTRIQFSNCNEAYDALIKKARYLKKIYG
ncbi:MAG: Imm59 family immunity protein [Anaerofustis sp.]